VEQSITNLFLQKVAGTIETLLLEEQEKIDATYKKIGGGMKVAIGLVFDPSGEGVDVGYELNYALAPKNDPVPKRTIKKKETIDTCQLDFMDDLKTGRVKMSINGQDVLQQ